MLIADAQLSYCLKRKIWRRGRDSNPRYGCPYAAFRVRCIRPLCHLSIKCRGLRWNARCLLAGKAGSCKSKDNGFLADRPPRGRPAVTWKAPHPGSTARSNRARVQFPNRTLAPKQNTGPKQNVGLKQNADECEIAAAKTPCLRPGLLTSAPPSRMHAPGRVCPLDARICAGVSRASLADRVLKRFSL